jgi:glycosyltransferase involved in cell wall biosynthesis
MIAVVTSGFPRRSETFVLNELLALDRCGALAAVFAAKPGDGAPLQPGAERLVGRVEVLPAGSEEDRGALVADRLRGRGIQAVHGHFAHEPAAIARIAAMRLGVPFGFSTHARDARKVAPGDLASRARAAACVVACNGDVAAELESAGAAVRLLPHGVDLDRFRPAGRRSAEPLRLLAVGRLVPKKGFDVLLRACERLDVPFTLRIVGEGPESTDLRARAAPLGNRVTFVGALTHHELPAEYAACDLVVAPSLVDVDGDRDGARERTSRRRRRRRRARLRRRRDRRCVGPRARSRRARRGRRRTGRRSGPATPVRCGRSSTGRGALRPRRVRRPFRDRTGAGVCVSARSPTS